MGSFVDKQILSIVPTVYYVINPILSLDSKTACHEVEERKFRFKDQPQT